MTQPSVLSAERLISVLQQALERLPHVKAAWLRGSFGRPGDADRHSDIDLHVWLTPEDAKTFQADLKVWLGALQPVLLYHELFGGHMIVSLLQEDDAQVIALDVFVETGEEQRVTLGKVRVLLDRDNALVHREPDASDFVSLRRELGVEASYFWRLLAMLPSIERGELIPAVQRLSQEVAVVVNVCTLGRGRPRDVGEKRANELLDPSERAELESVLVLPALTRAVIVRRHLELAGAMRRLGRLAARHLQAPYPDALETAVLAYVECELTRMGLGDAWPDSLRTREDDREHTTASGEQA